MSKIFNIALPAALLVSTLFMSACATESETAAVATPEQAGAFDEKSTAPGTAPAAATDQTADNPATKKKARKAKKKATKKTKPAVVAPSAN